MTTAVIRTGGQQHRVAAGDVIRVATLAGKPGDPVDFNEVLAIMGDTAKIGTPTVPQAKVTGLIVNHGLGEKVVVFKFRKRKRYRRKAGHRQAFTAVKITAING